MKFTWVVILLFSIFVGFASEVKAQSACVGYFAEIGTLRELFKDPDLIDTPEKLGAYVDHLMAEKTDLMTLVFKIEETKLIFRRRTSIYHALIFLYHHMSSRGLVYDVPLTDLRPQPLNEVKTRSDLDRFILIQLQLGKSKGEILNLVKQTSYSKQYSLIKFDIERWIEGIEYSIQIVKDFYVAFKNPMWRVAYIQKQDEFKENEKYVLDKEGKRTAFVKLLNEGSEELFLDWGVIPENATRYKNMYTFLHQAKATRMIFDPDGTMEHHNRFLGSHRPNDNFFETVYKNYDNRIRDEIIRLVKQADESLPMDRQGYGTVMKRRGDRFGLEVIGTMRVFDGTPLRLTDVFKSQRRKSSPELPFEKAFKARGIPVQFIAKLEQRRRDAPYDEVFEVGKLSLEGPPEINDRAMKVMDLFLMTYYFANYPKATFIAHVASEAHVKLYQRRYGFKVVETVTVPGSTQKEYILTISAADYRAAIAKRLGISL